MRCHGVRIYAVNAEDFQRPKVWMKESLSPALAAVVAAPIRKLWPLNEESSIPADLKAWRNDWTRRGRERVAPSWNTKSGPGDEGRMAKYPNIAATGHKVSPVAPMWSTVPAPKGSVLDCFRRTARCVGATWESTATSRGANISSLKAPCDGQVSSPALMNPKNARQKAAHSIFLLKSTGCCDQA